MIGFILLKLFFNSSFAYKSSKGNVSFNKTDVRGSFTDEKGLIDHWKIPHLEVLEEIFLGVSPVPIDKTLKSFNLYLFDKIASPYSLLAGVAYGN